MSSFPDLTSTKAWIRSLLEAAAPRTSIPGWMEGQPREVRSRLWTSAKGRKLPEWYVGANQGGAWFQPREPDEELDSLLRGLHQLARGKPNEFSVWEGLLEYIPTRLPGDVAHDLIDRGIACEQIGSRWEPDDVLFRLASETPSAHKTLAQRRYMRAEFPAQAFAEVLERLPTPEWLLTLLMQRGVPSEEKSELLIQVIRKQPNIQRLKGNAPEWVLERLNEEP